MRRTPLSPMRQARFALAIVLGCVAATAAAQTLYRWTDEKGRVHVTDTPPPPNAKGVKKEGSGAAAGSGAAKGGASEPYALQVARKNYPVTLYTTPGCEGCNEARKLLNARGVPFKEVSVLDDKAIEELKKAVGSNAVPAVTVGAIVQKGFEEGAYQRILDAPGYPKPGLLPARSQPEPAPPAPQPDKPAAAPEEPQKPLGPYAPGAPPQRSQKK